MICDVSHICDVFVICDNLTWNIKDRKIGYTEKVPWFSHFLFLWKMVLLPIFHLYREKDWQNILYIFFYYIQFTKLCCLQISNIKIIGIYITFLENRKCLLPVDLKWNDVIYIIWKNAQLFSMFLLHIICQNFIYSSNRKNWFALTMKAANVAKSVKMASQKLTNSVETLDKPEKSKVNL